jgi:hypothetical protein
MAAPCGAAGIGHAWRTARLPTKAWSGGNSPG